MSRVQGVRDRDFGHLISDVFFPYEILQELEFFEDLSRCDYGKPP